MSFFIVFQVLSVESLIEPCDRSLYRERKQQGAEKLGVSIRSIERLMKKYREEGFVGIIKTRADKGTILIDQDKKLLIIVYNGKIRIKEDAIFIRW